MPVPKKSTRRIPTQRRARDKYDTILRACRDVLCTEGFERTTTAKVAARAGVGKGVLYQYFPNREILVATLVEREFERLVTRTIGARNDPDDASPADTARRLLRLNVGFWLDNRKLLRVILNEVPGVFDLPGVRRIEDRLAGFVQSFAQLVPAGRRSADIERKFFVLSNLITGLLFRLALVDRVGASADDITDELLAVLEGYLDRSGLGAWLASQSGGPTRKPRGRHDGSEAKGLVQRGSTNQ